jgi:hypothetical protein
MKKNLLFIICDALTQKNIDFIIANQKTFPGFNKILNNSEIYTNFFSCAPVTEMVLPSIFSGSYPLDNGGYENGMKNKKNNFFDILIKNNYDLKIFSASSWLSNIYNYTNNKNTIENLFSIENAWQSFQKAYLFHIERDLSEKKIDEDYVKEVFIKHFKFFKDTIPHDQSFFTKYILKINHKNIKTLVRNIESHIESFNNHPKKYLFENLDKMLSKNFAEFFLKTNLNLKIYKKFNKFFWNKKKSVIPNIFFSKFNLEIRSPSQKYHANVFFDRALSFLKNSSTKPKAAIIHFFDVHDRNFSSNHIIKKFDSSNIHNFNLLKKNFKDDRKFLSLLYVDRLLTKFFEKLEINKELIIALTSDHGTTFRGDESSLNSTSLSGSFHDDYINIPLVIFKNEKKKLNSTLGSSVNILPIVLEKLDIGNINFQIENYSKNLNKSDYIILEHCHRGPCSRNLKKKIIYHCIRTNKFKYIHKFNIHPKDPSNNIKEVFINLCKDNLEKFNLINDKNYYQNINIFKQIVQKRIEHIFEQ